VLDNSTIQDVSDFKILTQQTPSVGPVEFNMNQGPNSVNWGTQDTKLFTLGIAGCYGIFFASPLVGTGLHMQGSNGEATPPNVQTISQFQNWLSEVLQRQALVAFRAFQAVQIGALGEYQRQWEALPGWLERGPVGEGLRRQYATEAARMRRELRVFVLVATPPSGSGRLDVLATGRNGIQAYLQGLDANLRVTVFPYDDQAITNHETSMQSTWGNLPAGVSFNGQCRAFS
jgi:hypothetical protein